MGSKIPQNSDFADVWADIHQHTFGYINILPSLVAKAQTKISSKKTNISADIGNCRVLTANIIQKFLNQPAEIAMS